MISAGTIKISTTATTTKAPEISGFFQPVNHGIGATESTVEARVLIPSLLLQIQQELLDGSSSLKSPVQYSSYSKF